MTGILVQVLVPEVRVGQDFLVDPSGHVRKVAGLPEQPCLFGDLELDVDLLLGKVIARIAKKRI